MENTDYNSSIKAMEKQIEFLKKLQELEKNNKTEIIITLL